MNSVENYKEMFNKVSKIVHDIDPINLGGVPGEYDNQVNEIIKLIDLSNNYKLSTDEIYNIFAKTFADSMTKDKSSFEKISAEIANIK